MENKTVTIRRYETGDEQQLFALIEREGEDWKDYWGHREECPSCKTPV